MIALFFKMDSCLPVMAGKILFPCVSAGTSEGNGSFGKWVLFGDGIPLPVSLTYGWVLCGLLEPSGLCPLPREEPQTLACWVGPQRPVV